MEGLPPAAAKVTAELHGKSLIALKSITAHTGCTTTDAVNQALQCYAYLLGVHAAGGKVLIQEPGDARPQQLNMRVGEGTPR